MRSYTKKRECKCRQCKIPPEQRAWPRLTVRARPGNPTQGLLDRRRRGVSLRARARRHLRQQARRRRRHAAWRRCAFSSGYFRGDHVAGKQPRSPMTPIDAGLGWCEVPEDRNYNRPVNVAYGASHETHAPRRSALRLLPGARLEYLAAPARTRQRHLLPPRTGWIFPDAGLRGGDRQGHGAAAAAISPTARFCRWYALDDSGRNASGDRRLGLSPQPPAEVRRRPGLPISR